DPEEKAHEEFFRQFWEGQAIGFPIAGDVEQVRSISRDALYDYYLEVLHPSKALICVAGNIESEECASWLNSRLFAIMEERRTLVRQDHYHTGNPLVHLPAKPYLIRTYKKTDAALAYVIQAAQTRPPSSIHEYLVQSALGEIAGGSSISRLFQVLREDEGLCYTVFSTYAAESSEAIWLVHMQTGARELSMALDRLESVIDMLDSEPPSKTEFEDALSRLIGSLQLAGEDTDYRQRRMARSWFAISAISDSDEELAQARSIRYDEVVQAARDLAGMPRARYVFGALRKTEMRKRGYVERK
ncbi:MAG: insulinase family protein, partial [Rectinema sp.]|nr:insulinase family protein [Rectinema sp.]